MPSSKGKPTDPGLREKVKEEVKQETNKDGGGKGQWSAWKAAKLSKEYERKGGSYENEAGSKNEAEKGAPRRKSEARKSAEARRSALREDGDEKEEGPLRGGRNQRANGSKKTDGAGGKKGARAGKGDAGVKRKELSEGTRRSSRISGKRKIDDGEEESAKVKKRKAR